MVSFKIGAKGELVILGDPGGTGPWVWVIEGPTAPRSAAVAGEPEPSEKRSTAIMLES